MKNNGLYEEAAFHTSQKLFHYDNIQMNWSMSVTHS